jgi:hypothetical protein
MRIAVAGTHCSGKSTLIADFLAAHPEFAHEPEPYEWTGDADFHRQLEVSVERLARYAPGERVIAERSPLDFVAYLLAEGERADEAMELAAEGMAHIDLLVVLPLDGSIECPADEDLELREAMNEQLLELVDDADVRLVKRKVELHGSREARLRALEQQCAFERE